MPGFYQKPISSRKTLYRTILGFVSKIPPDQAGFYMAERAGFELAVPLPVHHISSVALSTTQPPLQAFLFQNWSKSLLSLADGVGIVNLGDRREGKAARTRAPLERVPVDKNTIPR
jgi:hypothetical protein